MTANQLEALNAELVDAIERLLRNRIPHDNAITHAKCVAAKARSFCVFATSACPGLRQEEVPKMTSENGLAAARDLVRLALGSETQTFPEADFNFAHK